MAQVLYRKYRSRTLDELVGQEHLVTTLKRAIDAGRISHAYLFSGPRGVGKTSVARILAHLLNDMPYTEEDSHLDIIEIDAASNRGIDEIRDLREKVYIAPTSGKYKVYIIDEVHMLTTPAFNALLKTLEEPPAHVIFILATTEAHKLPGTIISRTQHYTFKPADRDKVIAHLRSIAKKEKIDISDDALGLIADHGEGSFRDSISLLDQASSLDGSIDLEALEELLGMPPASAIDELFEAMGNTDVETLLTTLYALRSRGHQAAIVAKLLGQRLRTELLRNDSVTTPSKTLNVLTRLIDVPASNNPEQLLELILLDVVLSNTRTPEMTPNPPKGVENKRTSKIEPHSEETNAVESISPKTDIPKDKIADVTFEEAITNDKSSIIDDEDWQNIMSSLKKQYNTLYSVVRMAEVEFAPGQVNLTFGFQFHQKQANNAKNKAVLTSVIEEITGKKLSINCLCDKDSLKSPRVESSMVDIKPQNTSPLDNISNIFGGGELLES